MLKKLGIVKSKSSKGYKVFTQYIEKDFLNNTHCPSEYVRDCWKKYQESSVEKNNALNGKIFEIIVATALVKEGITPLYLQANAAFVPNVDFDSLLFLSDNTPIAISMKTILRERYKQADLEAIALKSVYRKAKNYLITISEKENETVNQKIKDGSVMGLDESILATDTSFDSFIKRLKKENFIEPGQVKVVDSLSVVTLEKVKNAL